ncbi:hypothetical protein ABDD95_20495 [Mucilaginibacter sp. PAMB04274]
MKTSTQTTVLLKALDLELKAQLEKDLAGYRAASAQKTTKKAA